MKKAFKVFSIVLRVALGLALLYYILSTTGDWHSLYALLDRWWLLVAVPALPFFGALLECIRLRLLFLAQGIHYTHTRLYKLIAVGSFYNNAMPGGVGGDLVKLYYLAVETRGRTVETATILAVDRAVALFSWLLVIVVLGVLNASRLATHVPVLLMTASAFGLMTVLGLLALLSGSTALRSTRLFTYLTTRAPLHRPIHRIADALYTYRDQRHVLLQAALWSLPGHLATCAMYWAVASVLIPQAPGLLVCLLAFLGMLANVLPVTPGGLGVGEAAFHGLFSMFGYAGGAQLILAWRVAMLPFGILGGILYMIGVREKRQAAEEVDLTLEKKWAPGNA